MCFIGIMNIELSNFCQLIWLENFSKKGASGVNHIGAHEPRGARVVHHISAHGLRCAMIVHHRSAHGLESRGRVIFLMIMVKI